MLHLKVRRIMMLQLSVFYSISVFVIGFKGLGFRAS